MNPPIKPPKKTNPDPNWLIPKKSIDISNWYKPLNIFTLVFQAMSCGNGNILYKTNNKPNPYEHPTP